jgi:hypothetical protein
MVVLPVPLLMLLLALVIITNQLLLSQMPYCQ